MLEAIGVPTDIAAGALRMSFGALNDDASVDRVAEVFPILAEKARRLATA